MSKDKISSDKYLRLIQKRFQAEMPRIHKEIKKYEERLKKGQVQKFPKSAPQFNQQ